MSLKIQRLQLLSGSSRNQEPRPRSPWRGRKIRQLTPFRAIEEGLRLESAAEELPWPKGPSEVCLEDSRACFVHATVSKSILVSFRGAVIEGGAEACPHPENVILAACSCPRASWS